MKASILKKLLETIPDDQEVMVWNGFVGDWQDIDGLEQSTLHRQSFENYKRYWMFETGLKPEDEITPEDLESCKQQYNKYADHWSFEEFVTPDDVSAGKYQSKEIMLINPQPRGISTFDRNGDIEY
jgi:hypothetical protein